MQEELEPIFTSIYTVEMCTKILAMGFIMHPDSYLRYSWRQNKTAYARMDNQAHNVHGRISNILLPITNLF